MSILRNAIQSVENLKYFRIYFPLVECVCDLLGTDQKLGPCNKFTGQCPCLPNVTGQSCNQCEANHWKIASGAGCELCACDPNGSESEQCNQYDGQCSCKPGFGGRKCDQCQANFWGNPRLDRCRGKVFVSVGAFTIRLQDSCSVFLYSLRMQSGGFGEFSVQSDEWRVSVHDRYQRSQVRSVRSRLHRSDAAMCSVRRVLRQLGCYPE